MELMLESPALGPRTSFQRWWARECRGLILNVGAADDPCALHEKSGQNFPPPLYRRVIQYDLDYWPGSRRVQGDAHHLPFASRSVEMVIVGDVHEHLVDPLNATLEAARVASRWLVMTIFEEWRLPGPGQWIQQGRETCEGATRTSGYETYIKYMAEKFPEIIPYDDEVQPHHSHINQFTDYDIQLLLAHVCAWGKWKVHCFWKVPEQVQDGHQWSNWLIAMERQ